MKYSQLIEHLNNLLQEPSVIPDRLCRNSSLMKALDAAGLKLKNLHDAIDTYIKGIRLTNEELKNYSKIANQLATLQHEIRILVIKLNVFSEQYEKKSITLKRFQEECQKAIAPDDLKFPDMSWLEKNHPDTLDALSLTRKIDFNFVVLNLTEIIEKNGFEVLKRYKRPLQNSLSLMLSDFFNIYQENNDVKQFERNCTSIISNYFENVRKKEESYDIFSVKKQEFTDFVMKSFRGSDDGINDPDKWLITLSENKPKKEFLKQLNYLADKASNLHDRNEDEAALAAIKLCKCLIHGYLFFIQNENDNREMFQYSCTKAFNEVRPVLEKHRVLLNKILINLALAIAGLGIGFVIAGFINLGVTNGKHFFFFKTDSESTMDSMEDNIHSMIAVQPK